MSVLDLVETSALKSVLVSVETSMLNLVALGSVLVSVLDLVEATALELVPPPNLLWRCILIWKKKGTSPEFVNTWQGKDGGYYKKP